MIPFSLYKGIFLKLWSKVLQIFLFSLYFSSLNLKYLKLTKMELSRFAMKLFIWKNPEDSLHKKGKMMIYVFKLDEFFCYWIQFVQVIAGHYSVVDFLFVVFIFCKGWLHSYLFSPWVLTHSPLDHIKMWSDTIILDLIGFLKILNYVPIKRKRKKILQKKWTLICHSSVLRLLIHVGIILAGIMCKSSNCHIQMLYTSYTYIKDHYSRCKLATFFIWKG